MATAKKRTTTPRSGAKRQATRKKAGSTARAARQKRAAATPARSTRQRKVKTRTRRTPQRWSAQVTRESDALDLEPDVFKARNPRAIAQSLKRSADRSQRRKSNPYRSAMSMLTFYINRAGKNLSQGRKRVLDAAKGELRKVYGKQA